ncbi:MAG: hypothetical protein QOJ53_386 [Sphingomonadales bacterium]|jgi:nucleoid-associated protein YgaU|nr:hypothetical protein [Sphingomonadales bacterium]MEA3046054.1 hypothetical protein [Sphingomonadales bacterium]
MLEKLKITGFSDPLYNDLALVEPNPVQMLINPTRYTRGMGLVYSPDKTIGATGTESTYARDAGEALKLSLVIDGTGTVPDLQTNPNAPIKSVDKQLDEFRCLAFAVNGEIHTPNYLHLSWGTLLFRGRLKSLSIDYRLFTPEGMPLRATVDTEFIGFHENLDSRSKQKRSSPDLTHAVTVKAGDTLPLLCHRIYRDSRYYLAVAAHNGLDDFRALEPGTLLLFPPLAGAAS